ncbi:DUF803-domain-containing protein [Phellopilus nigrolimitatus]|nr:DUF803-domain-containing protein [Phellopilus nigrolimitatus]
MSTSASSSTSSAAASATTSAAATVTVGSNLKVVGIVLAVASGTLIGSSFVFKKKGLLRSQAGGQAGEGVAYLKSPLWWLGMTMMILGELCNFAAYAFVEALVVIGSIIIALNGPQEPSVGQIRDFEKLFVSAGFLSYAGVLIAISLVIIFYFAPKYGKKSMLWYLMFNYWFIYFLMAFVAITLITEVYYLNVALALFNTAMVTPTYYVIFTFFSMVTTVVLFKGLKAAASQIITIVMAFLVICCGITILQMSKIDPSELGNKLDRRSTLLLQAARSNTTGADEKDLSSVEDPGIDSIRGSFGPLGSMIRARTARRMSMSSHTASSIRSRQRNRDSESQFDGLQRHQLYDAPVPSLDMGSERGSTFTPTGHSPFPPRTPTIKFEREDVVHKYPTKGLGTELATHERRDVSYHPPSPGQTWPNPLTPVNEEPGKGSTDRLLLQQPRPQHASTGLPPIQKSLPRHDPFVDSPATSIGSSFGGAAATQPLPPRTRFSPVSDDDSQNAWRRERGRGHRRASSDRRYPRGEDDREESMSLVREPSLDDGSHSLSDEDDSMRRGGIRLVDPSPGRF